MLFDTHCHLNAEVFEKDPTGYIKRAQAQGVKYFIVIGWDVASSQKAINLAINYENVYAAVGIHPVDAVITNQADLIKIEQMLCHPKVVALGEVGLDYHWIKDIEERKTQKDFFIKQIALANKCKKPVIIHMRDATKDTFEILAAYQPLYSGVMHCYSGSKEMALEFLKLGLYISLGGPVTFKNAVIPKEVAAIVPLDKLLVETDAPYLAPHPYRGKQNESSLLPLIVKEIAKIRNLSVEEITRTTTGNARLLFHVEQ